MTPQALHVLTTVAVVALIGWRLYARIRRNIGRQRFSPRRPWITLSIFPLLLLLLGFTTMTRPLMEGSLWLGVTVGVGLGILGQRLTRYEVTAEGLFYTPSAHLGIALSALLVCRIVYRFTVSGGLPGMGGAPPVAGQSLTPLTLLLLGTLAGYYCSYAVGLLRWSARTRSAAQPQSPPA
jgi:energy-converting hydrogenase Eha subunit A